VISGFCREGDEICKLLGYYAAIVAVHYRPFGQPIGPIFKVKICPPETTVRNYHYTLRNIPDESRSQISIIYKITRQLLYKNLSTVSRNLQANLNGIKM